MLIRWGPDQENNRRGVWTKRGCGQSWQGGSTDFSFDEDISERTRFDIS